MVVGRAGLLSEVASGIVAARSLSARVPTASEAAPPPDETSEPAPPAAPTPDETGTAYAGELFTKHAGHWCRVAARLVADVDGAGPGLLDGDRPLVLLDGCAVAASQRTDLGATPGRFFLAVTDAGGARRELACASVVERDVWVNAMQSALDAWAVATARAAASGSADASMTSAALSGRARSRAMAGLGAPGAALTRACVASPRRRATTLVVFNDAARSGSACS